MKQKLIQLFQQHFTYHSNQARLIGMEGEFPLVDQHGQAIDYEIIRKLFVYLDQHGFDLTHEQQQVIQAKQRNPNSANDDYAYDVIGTDTGYSILELSLAPMANLFSLQQRLQQLLILLVDFFNQHHVLLLGYGVQPLSPPHQNLLSLRERYLFFKQASANQFIAVDHGHDCDFLTISASNQTHIDVSQTEAIDAINCLNGLSGLLIILCANSPIWQGQVDQQSKAVRETVWAYCFPQRQQQVGMPIQFASFAAYVDYISQFKMHTVQRQGRYFSIPAQPRFIDYMQYTHVIGQTLEQQVLDIKPELNDFYHHCSYVWFNARLAPQYGTLESRVCYQQPPNETLCSHALVLGLIENLPQTLALLNRFPWSAWKQLRLDALQHTFQAKIAGQTVQPLLLELLNIAQAGLQQRGLNEDIFLSPLFQRYQQQQSPADQMIQLFQQQGLTAVLQQLSFNRHLG